MRSDPETNELILTSLHPGVTIDQVRAETGWDLKPAGDVPETPPPTEPELTATRRFDPEGFWTRSA